MIKIKHKYTNTTLIEMPLNTLQCANLQCADLQGADLRGVNLQDADLRDVNLDFSCLPLWCGSFDVKVDNKLLYQLAYHICRLRCDTSEGEKIRKALVKYASKFHRADDCGKIKE